MTERARFVVVGAGSAGCVLAARLSAGTDGRVVLVEAGGRDRRAEIRIPAAFPRLFGTEVDWAYETVPQPGLGSRRLPWPRGRVLGGSSSLNAQIWTRGHRADYDDWARDGSPGWSAEQVWPYFRRAEDRDTPDPVPDHPTSTDGRAPRDDRAPREGRAPTDATVGYGTGGPLRIEDLRDPDPTTADFLLACTQAGLGPLRDGDPEPEGAGPVRTTQRSGRRWSSADGYLHPASGRDNLEVVVGALVRRVLLDGTRAVGVEYEDERGEVRRVLLEDDPRSEVVLAAGAVGSPQLLMLSGIGDPVELSGHGVGVRVRSPNVGRRLADHLYVPLAFSTDRPVTPGIGDTRAEIAEFLGPRRGRLTSNLAEALAFVRSSPGVPAPDLELVWITTSFLGGRQTAPGHGVTLGVVLLRPVSTGRVALASPDPAEHPLIDPGYLLDPSGQDLRVLTAGVRLARQVLTRPALADVLGESLTPGALDGDVAELVRGSADTLYHPVGTCRMGTAPDDVLDPDLRVRGTQALRVVDASAMPSIPRAHTHAPTVMLAERAADLILTDARQGRTPHREALRL